ncbi:lipoprotein [Orrella sp. NBD-18]|uniref:Lipoprotein n=1 Tax=Sheuella amnicola TaxID=2707330 RepID=A0A6B2R3I5_9BURK|nr:lipoprotein [Sheuella amnicola]NDY83617.1 lipoprotein [Sheuella amnicola]HBI82507.1 lipoprotein [Alcaligenaceae bacterium]
MAGPVIAIIGCAITISFAFKNFSDQPLLDGGMKRGLVVEKNLTKPTSESVTR